MLESLLLSEMRGIDIDWLRRIGTVQHLAPDQGMGQADRCDRATHLVLKGKLDVILPYQDGSNPKVLGQIGCGSWVGAIPGLDMVLPPVTLQATTPCQILVLEAEALAEQLTQDPVFAGRFYRMQAGLIMAQIQAVMVQCDLNPVILYQVNVKEASSLFAELQDSHLDWFSAVGQWRQLPGGHLVQAAYRPIEGLHIVLDGALSLGTPPELITDLSHLHSPIAPNTVEEVARIARGDIFGELRSLQSGAIGLPIHLIQVHTLRDTELLSVPYWRLMAKLLHDGEFARHYYRALARLIAGKYQSILTRLGFMATADGVESGSDRILAQVAKAEASFEWMEKRIQSKVGRGGEIQWMPK
jgi:CRP-like cAMP-binding protein